MGNVCSINSKNSQIDVPVILILDKEIKLCLEFLIAKNYFNKTEESKVFVNNQLKEIFSNYENTDVDMESLFNKKPYNDIFSRTKEELDDLKLESYGLFEQNDFIEFTKMTVINHYCYLIENDKNMIEM